MGKKIIGLVAFCILLSSCVCTRRTDNSVLDAQRQVSEYESQLRARDRAIEAAIRRLDDVTARSEGMGNDFDEVIQLLDEYERTVREVLSGLRAEDSGNKTAQKDPADFN